MSESIPIALVVGLGNPGSKYQESRHNAGTWFVERLAERYGTPLQDEPKFHGRVARVALAGQDFQLLVPTTFMNQNGLAVASLAAFYKISREQILVAHDDLDLPLGVVRLKRHGGHGGHNGLKDLIAQLGGNTFTRLRFGINHPGASDAVVPYVLGRPSLQDRVLILDAIEDTVDAFPLILEGQLEQAMNELHSRRIASPDV
jgi:peptidyl-tRNA hydrolase